MIFWRNSLVIHSSTASEALYEEVCRHFLATVSPDATVREAVPLSIGKYTKNGSFLDKPSSWLLCIYIYIIICIIYYYIYIYVLYLTIVINIYHYDHYVIFPFDPRTILLVEQPRISQAELQLQLGDVGFTASSGRITSFGWARVARVQLQVRHSNWFEPKHELKMAKTC